MNQNIKFIPIWICLLVKFRNVKMHGKKPYQAITKNRSLVVPTLFLVSMRTDFYFRLAADK